MDEDFERLMSLLEDWYADSTRARAYDADGGPGSTDPGHRVLRANRYPGPPWRQLYREATERSDLRAQAAIVNALEDEIYGLDHSPSMAGPASGLHPGTQEYERAIALHDGTTRFVARKFGVSQSTVVRYRAKHHRRG